MSWGKGSMLGLDSFIVNDDSLLVVRSEEASWD